MNIIEQELSEKKRPSQSLVKWAKRNPSALLSPLEKGNLAVAYSGFSLIIREAY